ncbi:hypothetical protein F7725_023370 [Dissostichus mawsoni]|uniref:Uncharacterized protein n=1 Tax=Dissostichus mawsoni TaxID=36200 RepID=A0A7J5Z0I2_DISMA|nr:hypothetical protein F7725_023370 [Dissostichus mawsoni]
MLAEGSHGANFPGLCVVSGPQGSPPGLVIQGIEGPKSPASPVSPTFFLPGSPGVSTGSGPAKGWKMIGPNPDGKYMLVKDKSRPDDAGEVDPGSSQGNLPRGAILVKEAAPPQGVLDLAAQWSVYGILPGHTAAKREGAVAVNSHLGQTRVGQPGVMGLVPVTAFGIGVGKPGMGMAHVMTVKPEVRQVGMWPPGMTEVGIRQVSTNQFQETTQLQQTADTSGILKASGINSPKEDKTTTVVNTIISAETHPSNEEVLIENQLKDPVQNMNYEMVEEKHDVPYISMPLETTLDDEDPGRMVQTAFEDKLGIQECPTQTSETAPTESNVPQQNSVESEQQENHLPAKVFQRKYISGQSNVDHRSRESIEISTIPQGEGSTSTLEHINIVDDQIQDITEVKVDSQESLKGVVKEGKAVHLTIVEGLEDKSQEVGSEPQLDDVTEDQMERDLRKMSAQQRTLCQT